MARTSHSLAITEVPRGLCLPPHVPTGGLKVDRNTPASKLDVKIMRMFGHHPRDNPEADLLKGFPRYHAEEILHLTNTTSAIGSPLVSVNDNKIALTDVSVIRTQSPE